MISYSAMDIFYNDSIRKEVEIDFGDGKKFTQADIVQGSFRFEESICSEQSLRYGACEPKAIYVTLHYHGESLVDAEFDAYLYVNKNYDEPIPFGHFKVDEAKISLDRAFIEISAYDYLSELLEEKDVSDWYNGLIESKSFPMKLKDYRDSLFAYLDIQQMDTVLPNDNMDVEQYFELKKADGTEMEATGVKFADIIKPICEINGRFGQVDRTTNKFKYVKLKRVYLGLYPSESLLPSETLYPQDPTADIVMDKSHFVSAAYSDYTIEPIKCLSLIDSSDTTGHTGATWGEVDEKMTYTIEGNHLVYGKDLDTLKEICHNIFDDISYVTYDPVTLDAMGNPCLEAGDSIVISGKDKVLLTYIFKRTFKLDRGCSDEYVSDGEQYWSNINSSLYARLQAMEKGIARFKTIIAEKIIADEAHFESIETNYASIKYVESTYIDTSEFTTNNARISNEITVAANSAVSTAGRNAETKIGAGFAEFTNSFTENGSSVYGKTTIYGGNITTGTIAAARIASLPGNKIVLTDDTQIQGVLKADHIDTNGIASNGFVGKTVKTKALVLDDGTNSLTGQLLDSLVAKTSLLSASGKMYWSTVTVKVNGVETTRKVLCTAE